MSDPSQYEAVAAGRPTSGAVLAQSMAQAADRRPKSRDLKPLAGLWPHIRAHIGDAILACLFLLISSSATVSLSIAGRMVVDHGLQLHSYAALNETFGLLAGVVATLALATALRFYFVSRLGERVVADLRKQLYDHILTLDPAFFLNTRTGEVLSRMTTDMTVIETVSAYASIALRNILMFVGSLTMLIIFVPRYTIFVLVLVVFVLAPLIFYGRRVRKLSMRAQDRFADAVGFAGESLDALETVQAFNREKSVSARFGQGVEAAFRASMARVRARAFMAALVITLIFAGVGGILYLASSAVFIQHTMTGGVLLQFIVLSILAASSVGQIGEVMGEVQKAAGAMDRISELLAAKPSIAAPAHPIALPTPPKGAIAFEHVTFAYPGRPDLAALRDFTLTVNPGERVALVGPSGAGKSTVLRLILRFYDPQSGKVRIDGVDLRQADPAQARARIALVGQDAPLFSGSAYENLAFGREGASPEAMRAAAQAAQADGFLSALPEGYDTPIGERAKTLSGGQRQRLAIARALLRDAPILLLDEATSALDAENERLVQAALSQAMVGRTTVVIAHRLATVLEADRIVVMEDGHVVEQGAHAELVAKGGLYARLARLQFGVEAA
ncbi:MAG: ATP-binding cassette domain-containing protein [Caulobacteraceae bacterium]|nr:ATP-binding cassette domain-containing protein [Caulobacteraceae bacterium]